MDLRLDFAFDNPDFGTQWRDGALGLRFPIPAGIIPAGVVDRIEDGKVLQQYKAGKEMACADIAICTRKRGKWMILLSKRGRSEAFGRKWWLYGGSVGAYKDILAFIAARAQKECGVVAEPEALVGFYRTCADDLPQSTTQPCFVTRVPYEAVKQKMSTDSNHDSVRLFTLAQLKRIPKAQCHWYPMHIARLVLQNMPE